MNAIANFEKPEKEECILEERLPENAKVTFQESEEEESVLDEFLAKDVKLEFTDYENKRSIVPEELLFEDGTRNFEVLRETFTLSPLGIK